MHGSHTPPNAPPGEAQDTSPEALIEPFEDAVIGRASLSDAFDAFARRCGGSGALMFSAVDQRPGLIGGGFAQAMQRAYQTMNWKSADVLTPTVSGLPRNAVVFAQDFLTPHMIDSSRFFTEFLAGFDMKYGAGWIFDLDGEPWAMAIARSAAQGKFTEADRARVTSVAPRVSRCLILLNQSSATRAQGAREALDSRDRPYVIYDHMGRVTHISSRAVSMLNHEALTLRDGKLFSCQSEANERLQNISLAARYGAAGIENLGIPAPEEFFISRGDVGPAMVTIVRLRAPPLDALPGPQILVRLSDFEHHPTPRAEPMRALYGLSPREIEIAQHIAVGKDPAKIAEDLNLKASYVRQVVKSIGAKTGRNRIGDLVALLARLPDTR